MVSLLASRLVPPMATKSRVGTAIGSSGTTLEVSYSGSDSTVVVTIPHVAKAVLCFVDESYFHGYEKAENSLVSVEIVSSPAIRVRTAREVADCSPHNEVETISIRRVPVAAVALSSADANCLVTSCWTVKKYKS